MNLYFNVSGSVVVDFLDFDFTLFVGFYNRFNNCRSGLSEWQLQ